jgi:hypothetical protein
MTALKSGQRGLVVVVSTNTARAVCYVSRILEGCPGKHPALKNWRKVAMWKSCTWAVCPLEGVLWHPLGIHVWAVMAANKKSKTKQGKKHMNLARQDGIVTVRKRVKQNMSWGKTVGQ